VAHAELDVDPTMLDLAAKRTYDRNFAWGQGMNLLRPLDCPQAEQNEFFSAMNQPL
jgi:hypothetical protein